VDGDGDGRGALTAAGVSCGSCGSQLGITANFCSECGTRVAPGDNSAEYKQVTVLFADVVRSMDIAAALGAERLREIMAELVDRCAEVVKRSGGTLDKFTGDGIMAIFGAPVALEDHAVRAALAALSIQEEAARLAVVVKDRDGIDLRLRAGLNSGQVIVGEIGSRSLGYTAVGEPVGMAQRMESVAPSGGVMLSASTARLLDGAATLSDPETVRIKGTDFPVVARRLLSVSAHAWPPGGSKAALVGRSDELNLLKTMLERSIGSTGCVVRVIGAPGIGKTRLVREAAAIATSRGIGVLTAFCESHARDVPFHVVTQLLRAITGVGALDSANARARLHKSVPDATDDDLALLDDLLGVRDSDAPLPKIDPDAARRRLSALINSLPLARNEPTLYVIEDAHWIDAVSESLLETFLTVIPRTRSLVLVTYRPEYRGALAEVSGVETISLDPLSDSSIDALLMELLGADTSVAGMRELIAGRALGNPFFAEEMVRDLAERRLIVGQPGARVLRGDVAEIEVPATLQATIAARIDRLRPPAKRTLYAAAVIGSRFDADLLSALVRDADVAPLMEAELVEPVRVSSCTEYAFRHPLIRTVAYQSQLKSDRARLHRRVADLIVNRDPSATDQTAALIAEHVEAGGDLNSAYAWHMRAGSWSASRDIRAARLSWERARQVAGALPDRDPNRTTMAIAPLTVLCGTAWRVNESASDAFDELRRLSEQTGDKASLVLGMAGLAMDHILHARVREASLLASEYMALVESMGDWALTARVTPAALYIKYETGELAEGLRLAQRVIDLVEADTTGASVDMGSPLAAALVSRGVGRLCLGLAGWRKDLEQAATVARATDPMSHAAVVDFAYAPAITCGALPPDDHAIREIEQALAIAERAGDDIALGSARFALGLALVYRGETDADRGLELLLQVREMCVQHRFLLTVAPQVDAYVARQLANRGDSDGVLPRLRAALEELFERGHPACRVGTEALVEVLLMRGAEADIAEAQAVIDRFAESSAGGLVTSEILLLRLRSLMAGARGDATACGAYRDRYRELTASVGFGGDMSWAEGMR
jgi:class 3 adenylate cyclase